MATDRTRFQENSKRVYNSEDDATIVPQRIFSIEARVAIGLVGEGTYR